MSVLRYQDLQARQGLIAGTAWQGPLGESGPFFFLQLVSGGSSAPSNTSVADTASSTPSILKISTLVGLFTRAIVFFTRKCFLAICSAMRLSPASPATPLIASARRMPAGASNPTAHPSLR